MAKRSRPMTPAEARLIKATMGWYRNRCACASFTIYEELIAEMSFAAAAVLRERKGRE